MGSVSELIEVFVEVIINPLLALIFAAGLLVFVYGIVEFLWGLSNETDAKNTGKKHMFWGVVGMFVMVAAYAIIAIIKNSIPQMPA